MEAAGKIAKKPIEQHAHIRPCMSFSVFKLPESVRMFPPLPFRISPFIGLVPQNTFPMEQSIWEIRAEGVSQGQSNSDTTKEEVSMKTLVRLWKRPSHDGKKFSYYLLYYDENGERRQKALGHTDARKAERERAQLERELRMGIVEPGSMKLTEFLKDSLERTRGQVRENTL
jgi:hypothetical protein